MHTKVHFCKFIKQTNIIFIHYLNKTNMPTYILSLIILCAFVQIEARDSANVISREFLDARKDHTMNKYLSYIKNLQEKYHTIINHQNDFSFFAQIVRKRGCNLNGELVCLQCSNFNGFNIKKYCPTPKLNKMLEIHIIKQCDMKVVVRTNALKNFDCKNFQNSFIFTFS